MVLYLELGSRSLRLQTSHHDQQCKTPHKNKIEECVKMLTEFNSEGFLSRAEERRVDEMGWSGTSQFISYNAIIFESQDYWSFK